MNKTYYKLRDRISIDIDGLAKQVRIGSENKEGLQELIDLVNEAMEIAKPKALLAKLEVKRIGEKELLLNGILFESEILSREIIDDDKVYGLVCTCGHELEDWSKKHKEDPLLNYYADYIMAEILWEASSIVKQDLKDYLKEPLSHSSPGSTEDFTLDNQHKLFEAIGGVEEKIGVRLTKDSIMIPLKSISSIYFISKNDYSDCQTCMRVYCPRRKAPYINS